MPPAFAVLTQSLAAKRLEIIREIVPTADRIALLINPTNTPSLTQVRDTE